MVFKTGYRCLEKQITNFNDYSLIPIRFSDRFEIMKWRNEQMYHLRQAKLLSVEDQDYYFNNVISKLFEKEKPNQILFSLLHKGKCIGYGGLVHVNWIDKNAEISFIMDTNLEKKYFDQIWDAFLILIFEVAFEDLKLHKINTYAFDLRPHIYPIFERNGFDKEAILKEHCLFNNNFIDVIIHSKIN